MSTIENVARMNCRGAKPVPVIHDEADTSELRGDTGHSLAGIGEIVLFALLFIAGAISGYALCELKNLQP